MLAQSTSQEITKGKSAYSPSESEIDDLCRNALRQHKISDDSTPNGIATMHQASLDLDSQKVSHVDINFYEGGTGKLQYYFDSADDKIKKIKYTAKIAGSDAGTSISRSYALGSGDEIFYLGDSHKLQLRLDSAESIAVAVGREKSNYSGIILGDGRVISAAFTKRHIPQPPIIYEVPPVTPDKVELKIYNNYDEFVADRISNTENFYISFSGNIISPITKHQSR